MAANFIHEKLKLKFGDFAFVLSLILHLSLLLAIGSLLPQSFGENRIVQVYLAADVSNSSGGFPSLQPKAAQESLPFFAAAEPSASASSASTSADDELNTEITKPSHPALIAVRRPAVKRQAVRGQPSPVADRVTVAELRTSQTKSIVATKAPVAVKKQASQPISAPVESVSDKGLKGVTESPAGPASKNASEDFHSTSGAPDQAVDRNYFAAVFAKIEAAKKYPQLAIRRRMEGNVEVVFHLGNEGSLLAVALAKSSGYRSLDEAAIAAVNRAAPFPRPPKNVRNIPESLKITISFILSTKD